MKVEDIMTKNPACCTPESKIVEVARLMEQCDCGVIPVVEDQTDMRPIGVVTDRDIVMRAVAKARNPLDMTARDLMSSPAVTVTPDTELEECCQKLEDHQIRRVPVVDARGRCCGMIAQADIVQCAPEDLTAEVLRAVSEPIPA